MWIFFHLFSKWIVSGLIGVNGLPVQRLVEKEYKKENGLWSLKPNMEGKNAMAVTRMKKRAIEKNAAQVHTISKISGRVHFDQNYLLQLPTYLKLHCLRSHPMQTNIDICSPLLH